MLEDKSFMAATFDLQSILQLPVGAAGPFYYKRKLVLFNLTIYQGSQEGYCFVWMETEGGRGANEIGSILFRYLSQLPSHIKEVSFFFDSCSGQNRNQHVTAMMLHAVRTLPVEIIEQKFLVSGHTQMECDSMHSAIEHSSRNKNLYVPNDWHNVMLSARRRKPYTVIEMKHDDFYDLKDLSQQTLLNRRQNTEGETVNWLDIRVIRVEKSKPNTVFYKTDFDEDFMKLEQGQATFSLLKPAYMSPMPIAKAKKCDLISLCQSGGIPSYYHDFYHNLPSGEDNAETDENIPSVASQAQDKLKRGKVSPYNLSNLKFSCLKYVAYLFV